GDPAAASRPSARRGRGAGLRWRAEGHLPEDKVSHARRRDAEPLHAAGFIPIERDAESAVSFELVGLDGREHGPSPGGMPRAQFAFAALDENDDPQLVAPVGALELLQIAFVHGGRLDAWGDDSPV